MKKVNAQEIAKRSKDMENDEVYKKFLENINAEIDRTIDEVAEEKGLTVSRVIEDYDLQIKKALFISRNEFIGRE